MSSIRFSWSAQSSTMYLYSTSPAGKSNVPVHTSSPSSSDSGKQLPHHPVNGPVMNTVPKLPSVAPEFMAPALYAQLMSTWNVVAYKH